MLKEIDMQNIIKQVQYKDWILHIGAYSDRYFLQVRFRDKCSVTNKEEKQHGRKWFLSPFMTKSELVQTCFKAILTAEEHEVREKFKYKDKAIFGPHYNIDVLVEILEKPKNILDTRE